MMMSPLLMARLRRDGKRSHIPDRRPNLRCIKTKARITNMRKNVMPRPSAKPRLLPDGSVDMKNYIRTEKHEHLLNEDDRIKQKLYIMN